MKRPLDRDEQTVTIATTLALFVAALLFGAAIIGVVEATADPSAGPRRAFATGSWVAAASIGLWYLVRNRRP